MAGLLQDWYVYQDEDGNAVAVARHDTGPNGGWVGRDVAHKPTKMSQDDWNTVARLSSAAPEMLEALKALGTFSGDLRDDEDLTRLSHLFAHARTVVAKAEGRT